MIAAFQPFLVQHVYGGHVLRIAIEDPLGRGWYDHDWPRLPEIELLSSAGKLRPGGTVFDLGAHQCLVALLLAAEVGEDGLVVAVEATPHNAEVGRRNLELNGVSNVIVENAAAAAFVGRIPFAASLNGHVGKFNYAFTTLDMPSVTVDSLCERYGVPDVIFVDVEGFEEQVLSGASDVFETRPDWFVEIHADVGLEDQGGSVGGILERFVERGYSLFVGDPEAMAPFVPFVGGPPRGRFHLVALG